MSATLKMSPQWGLNLSDELCFWCGTKTGKKIILGELANDAKAPEESYRGYTPCGTCEEFMKTGITLIQCTNVSNNNPPIAEGLYPTGVWIVVQEDVIRKCFNQSAADKICADKVVNLHIDLWNKLGLTSLKNTTVTVSELPYKETLFVEE